MGHEDSMYPPPWMDREICQLEMDECPWWLDNLVGRVHESE